MKSTKLIGLLLFILLSVIGHATEYEITNDYTKIYSDQYQVDNGSKKADNGKIYAYAYMSNGQIKIKVSTRNGKALDYNALFAIYENRVSSSNLLARSSNMKGKSYEYVTFAPLEADLYVVLGVTNGTHKVYFFINTPIKVRVKATTPNISSLNKTTFEATDNAQDLIIYGSNFTNDTIVYIDYGSGWESQSSRYTHIINSGEIKFDLRTTRNGSGTWKVKVKNSNGYSNYKTFDVKKSPTKPSTPSLKSPSNYATLSGSSQTLSWYGVSGAEKYEIYLRDETTKQWIFSGSGEKQVTSTSVSYNNFKEGHTYVWNLKALNSAGYSGLSETRRFTIKKTSTPINGECGTANNHTFLANDTGYGSYTQCKKGVANTTQFPSVGSTQSWTCKGQNGGINANCSASRESSTILTDKATFLSETIPDNTQFNGGESFTKTWTIKNIGTSTWNSGYKLYYYTNSGGRLSKKTSISISGTVAPNHTYTFSIPMQAPSAQSSEKTYTEYWQFKNPSGSTISLSGSNSYYAVWAKIKVHKKVDGDTSSCVKYGSYEEIDKTVTGDGIINGSAWDTDYGYDQAYSKYLLDKYPNLPKHHSGIDISILKKNVYSIADGTVTKIKNSIGAVYVRLSGQRGTLVYMHLSSILVKVGEEIKGKKKIGISGDKGVSGSFHLHLAWLRDESNNPIEIWRGNQGTDTTIKDVTYDLKNLQKCSTSNSQSNYEWEYIDDITYKDDTSADANSIILKKWKIRNSGTANWNNVILKECDSVGNHCHKIDTLNVASGATTIVQSTISLPNTKGLFKREYKLFANETTTIPIKTAKGWDNLYIRIYITNGDTNPITNGLYGIDVSSHNGYIDWSEAKRKGIRFAFIRSSQGFADPEPCSWCEKDASDSKFIENMNGALQNGILVAPYHVIFPEHNVDTSSIQKSAKYFASKIKAYYGNKDNRLLPPVIDIEKAKAPYLTKNGLETFVSTLRSELGINNLPIIIYTSDTAQFQDDIDLSPYVLWIAKYGCSRSDYNNPQNKICYRNLENEPYSKPTHFPNFVFWQFSDTSSLFGGKLIDKDIFYGSQVELESYLVHKNYTEQNSAPVHQKTYSDTSPIAGKAFNIYSKWIDNDNDYIVNVKVRYRKKGTSTWTNVILDYDEGSTFKRQITLYDSGTYDIQVQASDVKQLGDNPLHTTSWLSVAPIEVKSKDTLTLTLDSFNKEHILASNDWQYLELYGQNFNTNCRVEWKSGNKSGNISNDRTWASEDKIKIKFKTTNLGKGIWQFRVNNNGKYSNWKSIEAINMNSQLSAYENALGRKCPKGGVYIVDPWNFYMCECTSYVAWKINQTGISGFNNGYLNGHFGNAKNWATNARDIGWSVSKTPSVGAIANWTKSKYGHVAFVEAVNNDGTITISEYNKNYNHQYSKRDVSQSSPDYYIIPKTQAETLKPILYGFNKSKLTTKAEEQTLILNGKNFTSTSRVEWSLNGSEPKELKSIPVPIGNSQLQITFNTTKNGTGTWRFRVKNGNKYSDWKTINAITPVANNYPLVYNFSKKVTDLNVELTFYAYDKDNDLDHIVIYWDGSNSEPEYIYTHLDEEQHRAHTYARPPKKTTKTIYIYAYDKEGHRSVRRIKNVDLEGSNNTKIDSEKVAKDPCGGVKATGTNSIATATGAEQMTLSLLTVKGLNNISFNLSYNSLLLTDNSIGKGWNHNFGFSSYVEILKNGDIKLHWDDGHYNIFTRTQNNIFTSNGKGVNHDIIVENSDGSYTLNRQNRVRYSYNPSGNIASISNYKNQQIDFTFNDSGKITRVTDVTSGVYLDYSYNDAGKLIKVSDALKREVRLYYNSSNQLIRVDAPEGMGMKFEYTQEYGQLYKATYTDGTPYFSQTYNEKREVASEDDAKADNALARFTYDDDGTVLTTTYTNKIDDPIQYRYTSDSHQLLSIINKEGDNLIQNSYDEHHNLISSIDANNNKTQYSYDEHGNPVKIIYPNGLIVESIYDKNRNLLKRTQVTSDGTRYETTYTYDSHNNLMQKVLPNGETTKYTYTKDNLVSTITSPSGSVIRYTYDKGRLSTVTNPNGSTIKYSYDIVGRLIQEEDSLGHITKYEYDNADRLLRKIDPMKHTISYAYDQRGNKISQTDAMGHTTTYEYDNNNNLLRIIDPLGNETTYEYDGEDRVKTITYANGATNKFEYDALGRVTKQIDAMGNFVAFTYDALGNVLQKTDRDGNIIAKYKYDAMQKVVEAVDYFNNKTTNQYNQLGLLEQTTDPLGRVSKFKYDKLGRLTEAIDALNGISKQSFDAEGNTKSFTDPNNNTTELKHDKVGNLTEIKTASGSTTKYEYDANGLLIKEINGRGQERTYTYNKNGQVATIKDKVGTITYEYDANGNLTSIDENGKKITFVYDEMNRLVSYTDSMGNTIKYEYDSVGNLKTLTYPDGKTVSYDYNKANQLIEVKDWNNHTTTYEYDSHGRLIKRTYPNGAVLTRTYDKGGRLTSQKEFLGQNKRISEYAYEYDKVGNIIKERVYPTISPKALASLQMSYAKGNLLNEANQTKASFDADDNMLSWGDLKLTYDSRNRLIKANGVSYAYDVQNHRITTTINGKTTHYITNPNASLSQLLIKTDPDGSQTYYVYGLGLISQTKGNETHYYHYDLRGSTIALTDDTKAYPKITDTFAYAPYGKLLSHKKGTTDTPFLFVGQYGVMKEANNLYYMRARYYHDTLRRFVNRDTLLGEVGNFGSLNRFGYVKGMVSNYIDSLGLEEQLLTGPNSLAPMGNPSGDFSYKIGKNEKSYNDYWKKQESKAVNDMVSNCGTKGATSSLRCFASHVQAFEMNVYKACSDFFIKNAIQCSDAHLSKCGMIIFNIATDGESKILTSNKIINDFFKNTKYTEKVRNQLDWNDYHAFPNSVIIFAKDGKLTTVTDKYGKTYPKLEIEGSYNGKDGVFEFIKDKNGNISHRKFEPYK